MPLIPRRPTIQASFSKVILAPIGFLLIGLVTSWRILVVACVLMLFSMFMANEPLSGLVPSTEWFVTMVGVVIVIMIAAVPLAILEYLRPGSDGFTWVPTADCAEIARVYSRFLIEGRYQELYQNFSSELKAEFTYEQFSSTVSHWLAKNGACESVISASEVQLDAEDIAVETNRRGMDALIEVRILHESTSKRSVNMFCLSSQHDYQIVGIDLGIEQ
jgi:hypothetical protein